MVADEAIGRFLYYCHDRPNLSEAEARKKAVADFGEEESKREKKKAEPASRRWFQCPNCKANLDHDPVKANPCPGCGGYYEATPLDPGTVRRLKKEGIGKVLVHLSPEGGVKLKFPDGGTGSPLDAILAKRVEEIEEGVAKQEAIAVIQGKKSPTGKTICPGCDSVLDFVPSDFNPCKCGGYFKVNAREKETGRIVFVSQDERSRRAKPYHSCFSCGERFFTEPLDGFCLGCGKPWRSVPFCFGLYAELPKEDCDACEEEVADACLQLYEKKERRKKEDEEAAKREACPQREDGQHCNCWFDGDACCNCGAPAMTEEEKAAQGMETRTSTLHHRCPPTSDPDSGKTFAEPDCFGSPPPKGTGDCYVCAYAEKCEERREKKYVEETARRLPPDDGSVVTCNSFEEAKRAFGEEEETDPLRPTPNKDGNLEEKPDLHAPYDAAVKLAERDRGNADDLPSLSADDVAAVEFQSGETIPPEALPPEEEKPTPKKKKKTPKKRKPQP